MYKGTVSLQCQDAGSRCDRMPSFNTPVAQLGLNSWKVKDF